MVSLVIVILGAAVGWLFDGNVLTIDGSKTVWEVEFLPETGRNRTPFLWCLRTLEREKPKKN